MLTIALTGAESSGKSTLAQQLAQHYNTNFVPEYARTYIEQLKRPYTFEDIEIIARQQQLLQNEYLKTANPAIFFADTELIVCKIWSLYVFNKCSEWLLQAVENQKYSLYLLLLPNTKWVADGQRQHPNTRLQIHNLYEQELKRLNANYAIINNLGEKRFQQCIEKITYML